MDDSSSLTAANRCPVCLPSRIEMFRFTLLDTHGTVEVKIYMQIRLAQVPDGSKKMPLLRLPVVRPRGSNVAKKNMGTLGMGRGLMKRFLTQA